MPDKMLTLLFILLISLNLYSCEYFIETDFDTIEADLSDSISLFYHSYNITDNIMTSFEEIASNLIVDYPKLKFYKCNGDIPINRLLYEQSLFKYDDTLIFFQVNNNIELLRKSINDKDAIIKHFKSMHIKIINPDIVINYKNETDFNNLVNSKPVLIKYVLDEIDCSPCEALKIPFQRYAHYFTTMAFVEINCSPSSGNFNKEICKGGRNYGYPSIALQWNNNRRYINSRDTSFVQVERFILANLPTMATQLAASNALFL